MTHAALLLATLLASSPGCYLVSATRIEPIPCRFDAPSTDALRYAAREYDRDHPPRRSPPGNAAAIPARRPPYRAPSPGWYHRR